MQLKSDNNYATLTFLLLCESNNYTSIIKQSNLNPVIIDVKCFALKSAVDQINQISNKSEDANLTAVLEFGLDENYLMILYDNY